MGVEVGETRVTDGEATDRDVLDWTTHGARHVEENTCLGGHPLLGTSGLGAVEREVQLVRLLVEKELVGSVAFLRNFWKT